jgi:signal transduction histidine kinase
MSVNALRLVNVVGRPRRVDLIAVRPGRRWAAAMLLAADFAAAAVLGLIQYRNVAVPTPFARPGISLDFAQCLSLLTCAGLALRRLVPIPALAWTAAASGALVYFGYGNDPMTALGLVLYIVGTASRRRIALAGLAVAETGMLIAMSVPGHADMPIGRTLSTTMGLGAAWTVGFALRARRAYVAGLREQAEQRVQAEIDRSKRALAEERLRIARELHDIVSHSMSLIAVQAGVGAHVLESRAASGVCDMEQGSATLRTIEATSRAALRELRSMLGVLREGGRESDDGDGAAAAASSSALSSAQPLVQSSPQSSPPLSSAAPLVPAPDLSGLPELVARTRDTGISIDVTVTGAPDRLPGGVELAAYRIVQEALTNVVRHAKAEHAHIELEYGDEALCLTVADDGIGAAAAEPAVEVFVGPPEYQASRVSARPPGGPGHGLIGMRERVAMYGGEFSAGPGACGGYRVRALFPLSGAGR